MPIYRKPDHDSYLMSGGGGPSDDIEDDEPTVFDDELDEDESNGPSSYESRDAFMDDDYDSDDGSSYIDLGPTHSQWCDAQDYDRR